MRIRTHTNPFCCQQRFEKQDWNKIFPNFQNQLDLEIGFGRGIFLEQYAKNNPNKSIVGVEVRKKTVVIFQEKIDTEKIENVLLVHGNGQFALEDMFTDKTIDNIFIFHPDPWLKNTHHKRRVINAKLLTLAAQKLKPTSKIYVSTDVEELWEEILEVFSANKSFTKTPDDIFWNEFYQTRWNEISKEDNRTTFYATFKLEG
jgi:tRNA (guanine-N7-)-methyltransferase